MENSEILGFLLNKCWINGFDGVNGVKTCELTFDVFILTDVKNNTSIHIPVSEIQKSLDLECC